MFLNWKSWFYLLLSKVLQLLQLIVIVDNNVNTNEWVKSSKLVLKETYVVTVHCCATYSVSNKHK